jgi:enoyl-CoA hydratase/carnithine racemase
MYPNGASTRRPILYKETETMQLKTDKILAEKIGAVGWVTINNPERRNAISLEMWQAMGTALNAYGEDDDVRCVVLKGSGDKAFASGADISQFEKNRSDANAAAEYARISQEGRDAMASLEKPLIAMIQGFCMGGGLGIALECDMRIASDDSTFGIPAARLSIAYSARNVSQLVHLVGPAKAHEILITAKRYPAEEAFQMHLINQMTTVDGLEAAVEDITSRIAENAPLSMRASKLTIKEVLKAEQDTALLKLLGDTCFNSNDYKEGREAFMGKRKPVFTGS